MKRDFALWTGILAGPIVWLLSFVANFALAPWACIFQAKLALYIVSLIALILSVGSGAVAWTQWGQLGRKWPDEGGSVVCRSRGLAVAGVLLSAMFCLVIIAQSVPEIILEACQ